MFPLIVIMQFILSGKNAIQFLSDQDKTLSMKPARSRKTTAIFFLPCMLLSLPDV